MSGVVVVTEGISGVSVGSVQAVVPSARVIPVVVPTKGVGPVKGPKGEKGERGESGLEAGAISMNFSFGDASPILIGDFPPGERIDVARIDILTPFNGAGSSLSIGTMANPGLLMPVDLNDPFLVASFELSPMTASDGSSIYLFITPGNGVSAGSGHVLIRAH